MDKPRLLENISVFLGFRPLLKVGIAIILFFSLNPLVAQTYFNAWLTTCSHLIGPTGNPNTLKLALDQSKGLVPDAPGFSWDILIDLGDWTASQHPPEHEDGVALAKCFAKSLGYDRSRFFTLSGNHDGDKKGWEPGEFTRKYVNPLGETDYLVSSGFSYDQRQAYNDIFQLLDYPGTRWDRYLIRTGNVIWIMLSDRNEFDELALYRDDTSGLFQAGRGSAAGMPKGGYPSGSVTLDTFEWWKKVVEDSKFSNDIIITAHHILPANTTIASKAGEGVTFHGKSGSVGPNGEIGGQLYWIREYDEKGRELNQYAQTRPFLNYLQDHPSAIAAWIGGHTHVNYPEEMIYGRGMYVKKYGVTFLNVGALTDSHAGGKNQMSRLITFEDGKDEAIINLYVHKSDDEMPLGWYECSVRKFPLGKNFVCPESTTNTRNPITSRTIRTVPDAPKESLLPRYYWDLNTDRYYDFNNSAFVVGEDGSPYGNYHKIANIVYSKDTPIGEGKSLDLSKTDGRVELNRPYQPEINWENLTISLWLKTSSVEPQEIISYSSVNKKGKFRLWYDGTAWIWDVADQTGWRSARWESREANTGQNWHHFTAIVDSGEKVIQLYVDTKLVAWENWKGGHLVPAKNHQFVLGASGDPADREVEMTWSRPFNGLIDEVIVFDAAVHPGNLQK